MDYPHLVSLKEAVVTDVFPKDSGLPSVKYRLVFAGRLSLSMETVNATPLLLLIMRQSSWPPFFFPFPNENRRQGAASGLLEISSNLVCGYVLG